MDLKELAELAQTYLPPIFKSRGYINKVLSGSCANIEQVKALRAHFSDFAGSFI